MRVSTPRSLARARAVVESKAKCMARLNALMGVDDGEGDDDEEEDEEEENEEGVTP